MIFPQLVDSGVSPTFMEDLYFKRGTSQNYYLGVTGGSADVTYSVSGRLEDRTGTQPKDGSTNYSLRSGLQASITEDFTVAFSGSYVRHNFDRLYNGRAIADPLTTFEVGDALFFSGAQNLKDALDIFLRPDITESVNRFIFSAGARWNVGDDLTAKLTVGADNRANQQRIFQPIGFTPGEVTGELNRRDRSFTSVSLDAGTTYGWENPDNTVRSSLTLGVQGFREEESLINGNGRTFALPGTNDFDAAAVITAFEGNVEVFNGGLYVDEQLSLRDKLYLGVGFRVDAGSSFGDEIDTEIYPKATGSYVVSDDYTIRFINELKLRTAYGQTGKFPGAFLKDRTFSATPFRGESAPRFANPGNAQLRPERTSTIEAGFDAALLSNRVGLNFTWYDARTSDALFLVPRQPVTGLGAQQENVGEIWNWGVEVGFNVQAVNTRSLAWSVGGNFQFNHNEVTDMGGVPDLLCGRRPEGRDGVLAGGGGRRPGHMHWRTGGGLVGDDSSGHERGQSAGRFRAPVHRRRSGADDERGIQHDFFGGEQPYHQRPGGLGRRASGVRLGVDLDDLQQHLAAGTSPLRDGLEGPGDRRQAPGGAGRTVRLLVPDPVQPGRKRPGQVQPVECAQCLRLRWRLLQAPRSLRALRAPGWHRGAHGRQPGDPVCEWPQPVDLVAEPPHRPGAQRGKLQRRPGSGEREQHHPAPEPDVPAGGRGRIPKPDDVKKKMYPGLFMNLRVEGKVGG